MNFSKSFLYPIQLKILTSDKTFLRKNLDKECSLYQVIQPNSSREFLPKRRNQKLVSSVGFGIVILFCCFCQIAKAQTYFDINSISPNLIDPPIKIDSTQWKSEVKEILKLQSKFDIDRLDLAIFEKHLQPETIALFGDPTLTREEFPKLYHLLDRVGDTSRGVTDLIKDYHSQTRPYLADSRIKMLITPSKGSSYPSGHATGSYIYAHILGLLIPQKRAEFEGYAEKIAQNRILVGMHYPHDIAAGKNLSFLIVGGLTQNKEFQNDFKKAAREISDRN